MSAIFQAEPGQHGQQIQELFWEYLTWANSRNQAESGIWLDIHTMLEEDMAHLEKYMPPDGRLLIAYDEGQIVGCICLKALNKEVGELKRLYVRPTYRRLGIGKALVAAMIEHADQAGYHTLRLDSARYMIAAHTLYYAAGFRDIDPYLESEIPSEYHPWWVFMEMGLV